MKLLVEPSRRVVTAQEFVALLLPISGILIALGLHIALPNVYPEDYVPAVYAPTLVGCLAVYTVVMGVSCFWPRLRKPLVHLSAIIMVFFLTVAALDILTLKTGIFELPFIPCPDKIISTYTLYPDELFYGFIGSMKLLLSGFAIGAAAGFVSGVAMGWSKICNYWLSPILKLIGPLPTAALLPIAVVVMPSNHAAGLFLIALSVWFPMTLMLSSAIKSTDKRKVEVARVLGASETHILLHVALPAAMPAMFDGLFMGLSGSFGGLVVAEMLGVKGGLGWYMIWAKNWSDYGRVFSTTGIFIIIFFALIQILFCVRDRVLKWQKGLVRW